MFPDLFMFSSPLFPNITSAIHGTSGDDTSQYCEHPPILRTPFAVPSYIIGWLTRSLWERTREYSTPLTTHDTDDVNAALAICRIVNREISDIFHTLVVRNTEKGDSSEITELGAACTAYYIALIHMNELLIPSCRYDVHRGGFYSADEAPGTQIPWLSSVRSYSPTSSPRSSSVVLHVDEDDEMTLVDNVVRDDLYLAIEPDETVDHIDIRPYVVRDPVSTSN